MGGVPILRCPECCYAPTAPRLGWLSPDDAGQGVMGCCGGKSDVEELYAESDSSQPSSNASSIRKSAAARGSAATRKSAAARGSNRESQQSSKGSIAEKRSRKGSATQNSEEGRISNCE